jgi:hypothetical protein
MMAWAAGPLIALQPSQSRATTQIDQCRLAAWQGMPILAQGFFRNPMRRLGVCGLLAIWKRPSGGPQ